MNKVQRKFRYKHLLNLSSNFVIVLAESIAFAYSWLHHYSIVLNNPYFNQGNIVMVAFYMLLMYFITLSLHGYRISYQRTIDLIVTHIIAIVLTNIMAFMLISLIARGIVFPTSLYKVAGAQIAFVVPWLIFVRQVYQSLYPPRELLLIYGDKVPVDLMDKFKSRTDKFKITGSIKYSTYDKRLYKEIDKHLAVVLDDIPAQERNDILKYCYSKNIRTYVTPKISDIIMDAAEKEYLFDTPLYLARNYGISISQNAIKRLMDIVISVTLLLLASPFMLVIALAVKLYDGGPVFYSQERLTINHTTFMMHKFRSMKIDSEAKGAQLAKKNDDRITPVGKVIRRLHVDELPQLFSVLKGEMAFVGPRPERESIHEEYKQDIPEFDFRLKVKAGLTGFAQVYGKYNTTPYDKLKLDLTYIENYSYYLDIQIILMTVRILFQKDNSEGIDEGQRTAKKQKR